MTIVCESSTLFRPPEILTINRPNRQPDVERGRDRRMHEGVWQIVAVGSALNERLGNVRRVMQVRRCEAGEGRKETDCRTFAHKRSEEERTNAIWFERALNLKTDVLTAQRFLSESKFNKYRRNVANVA